jgi:hypothetical protein
MGRGVGGDRDGTLEGGFRRTQAGGRCVTRRHPRTGSVASAFWSSSGLASSHRRHRSGVAQGPVEGMEPTRRGDSNQNGRRSVDEWWTKSTMTFWATSLASGAMAPAELGLRLALSEGAMTSLLSMLAQEGKVGICLVETPLGRGRGTSPGSALAGDGRPAKWKNDRL